MEGEGNKQKMQIKQVLLWKMKETSKKIQIKQALLWRMKESSR